MPSEHTKSKQTVPEQTVRDSTAVHAPNETRSRRVRSLLLKIDALGKSGTPGAEDLAAFIRWRMSCLDWPEWAGGAFEFVSFAHSLFEDLVHFQQVKEGGYGPPAERWP